MFLNQWRPRRTSGRRLVQCCLRALLCILAIEGAFSFGGYHVLPAHTEGTLLYACLPSVVRAVATEDMVLEVWGLYGVWIFCWLINNCVICISKVSFATTYMLCLLKYRFIYLTWGLYGPHAEAVAELQQWGWIRDVQHYAGQVADCPALFACTWRCLEATMNKCACVCMYSFAFVFCLAVSLCMSWCMCCCMSLCMSWCMSGCMSFVACLACFCLLLYIGKHYIGQKTYRAKDIYRAKDT